MKQNFSPKKNFITTYVQKRSLILLLAFLFIVLTSSCQTGETINTVSIKAIPGLQYDLVRFQVKPGARVKLILTNTDDMAHNLLIIKPETRLQVVNQALQLEEKGPMLDYIPKSPEVLWSIPVISSGEVKSIIFTAPEKAGAYPYVCTFPGHGYVMYGVMYVTTNEDMPDIENDVNIPESRRQTVALDNNKDVSHRKHEDEAPKPLHPYEPTAPYLYRVHMENSSPAAIAVSLPHDLSYCWDAGTCRLRYAWKGGFVDLSRPWKGKPNAVAEIIGSVFFRDKSTYPLRIGETEIIPVTEYKGYRLINGFPEFHYTVNGTHVYELIQPNADGSGLVRTFRIPTVNNTVWFYAHPSDGVEYEASNGQWEEGKLMLSPGEARKFSININMIKKNKI